MVPDMDFAGADVARARSLALVVHVAAGYTPGPVTCLSRSLLLAWLLQREGIAAQLRIGVRREAEGDALAAHAWIEVAGTPVDDEPDVAARFLPFAAPLAR